MTDAKVRRWILVTGANKGLGFEIAHQLGREEHTTVIVAARDIGKGDSACQKLNEMGVNAMCKRLDVTDSDSINKLAEFIEEEHNGVLDVLVNNAGLAYGGDTFGEEEARRTFQVNYFGTKEMCKRFLPLLAKSKDGRIINICSRAGSLEQLSTELQERVLHVNTEEDLDYLVEEFLKCVREGNVQEKGWTQNMYNISKLAEIAYTTLIFNKQALERNVSVFAMCPGQVATDMTHGKGKSPEEGADTAVWLATEPHNSGLSGKFFGERHEIAW